MSTKLENEVRVIDIVYTHHLDAIKEAYLELKKEPTEQEKEIGLLNYLVFIKYDIERLNYFKKERDLECLSSYDFIVSYKVLTETLVLIKNSKAHCYIDDLKFCLAKIFNCFTLLECNDAIDIETFRNEFLQNNFINDKTKDALKNLFLRYNDNYFNFFDKNKLLLSNEPHYLLILDSSDDGQNKTIYDFNDAAIKEVDLRFISEECEEIRPVITCIEANNIHRYYKNRAEQILNESKQYKFGEYKIDPNDDFESQINELARLFYSDDLDKYAEEFNTNYYRLYLEDSTNTILNEIGLKNDYEFRTLDELFYCDYSALLDTMPPFGLNNHFRKLKDYSCTAESELINMCESIDKINEALINFNSDLDIKKYYKTLHEITYQYNGVKIIDKYCSERFFELFYQGIPDGKLTKDKLLETSNFFHKNFKNTYIDIWFNILKSKDCLNSDELYTKNGFAIFKDKSIEALLNNYNDLRIKKIIHLFDQLELYNYHTQRMQILEILDFYKDNIAKTQQNDFLNALLDWLDDGLDKKRFRDNSFPILFVKLLDEEFGELLKDPLNMHEGKKEIFLNLIAQYVISKGFDKELDNDIEYLAKLFNIDNINELYKNIMHIVLLSLESERKRAEILASLIDNPVHYKDGYETLLNAFKDYYIFDKLYPMPFPEDVSKSIDVFNNIYSPLLDGASGDIFKDFDSYCVVKALQNCLYFQASGQIIMQSENFINIFDKMHDKINFQNKQLFKVFNKWKNDVIRYDTETEYKDWTESEFKNLLDALNALIAYSDSSVIES